MNSFESECQGWMHENCTNWNALLIWGDNMPWHAPSLTDSWSGFSHYFSPFTSIMHTWVRLRIDSALHSLQWISAIPCPWINGRTAITMKQTHFTIISEACCTVSLIDSAMTAILWISAMLAEWLFLWIPRRFTISSWVSVDANSLNIRELLNSVNWSFQNFPIMSHVMPHPSQTLGQGFCMISGLFPSWSIHDYRQKSTVQSPESSKIVQKNTPK